MLLKDIAPLVKGTLYGDGNVEIKGVNEFDRAQKGDIVYIAPDIKRDIRSCKASAILTSKRLDTEIPQVIVKEHKSAFAQILRLFHPKKHHVKGISKKANISTKATIGEGVCIGPNSTISEGAIIGKDTILYSGVFVGKGVKIGESCVIYPNVVIMDHCIIGNNVIIHPCSVIGADGFGYVYEGGGHQKIPQIGNVVIEDDVEIGANTTIDRATLGSTIVGRGTKIDNLVQIGHNVKIGRNVIIVAQTGIGGSAVIGDGVMIAGQSGISDHAEIESGAVICARSGVTGRLSKNIYLGMPAKPYKTTAKAYEIIHLLPELKNRINKIEVELTNLKRSVNDNG